MSLTMIGSDGSIPLEGRAVHSNSETQFHNLTTYNPSYYVLGFKGIPKGVSVFVEVWIYG